MTFEDRFALFQQALRTFSNNKINHSFKKTFDTYNWQSLLSRTLEGLLKDCFGLRMLKDDNPR